MLWIEARLMKYRFVPSAKIPGGYIRVFQDYQPGMHYSLGVDTALGIKGKDLDAGVMFDTTGKQALTFCGTWGEKTSNVIRPILEAYQRKVFVVIERANVGLAVARALYDDGYWMYFERANEARGQTVRDKLGHAPTAMDLPIIMLQQALAPRDDRGELKPATIEIYDHDVLAQIERYGFHPRSSRKGYEQSRDEDLVMSAPDGEHDDLVRAAALGVAGLRWIPAYQEPKKSFPKGSLGDMLEHDKVLNPPASSGSNW